MPTPIKPRQFVSEQEKRDRDALLAAVCQQIIRRKLTADIICNNRPMSTKLLERLKRHEYDHWSLRSA